MTIACGQHFRPTVLALVASAIASILCKETAHLQSLLAASADQLLCRQWSAYALLYTSSAGPQMQMLPPARCIAMLHVCRQQPAAGVRRQSFLGCALIAGSCRHRSQTHVLGHASELRASRRVGEGVPALPTGWASLHVFCRFWRNWVRCTSCPS